MAKNRIDKPYHIRFAAIGPHARTGSGWVVHEETILTGMGEVAVVHWVQVDEKYDDDDGKYILLGDGEILEREEPVEWAEE